MTYHVPPVANEVYVVCNPAELVSVVTRMSPKFAPVEEFRPATPTLTGPVVVPKGTTAVIWVSVQFVTAADTPKNCTPLELCEEPKPDPLMVTAEPTSPTTGEKEVIVGVPSRVKVTPLEVTPLTDTVTGPFVVPGGMNVEMLVSVAFPSEA